MRAAAKATTTKSRRRNPITAARLLATHGLFIDTPADGRNLTVATLARATALVNYERMPAWAGVRDMIPEGVFSRDGRRPPAASDADRPYLVRSERLVNGALRDVTEGLVARAAPVE